MEMLAGLGHGFAVAFQPLNLFWCFVGVFLGTVVGIMMAFQKISKQGNASIDTVGQPIAEALLATAIGLVAAIPAVMAYNYFVRRIRVLRSEMEQFEQDYLNIIKRHFLH